MTVVYRRFGGSIHVRCDTFAQLREAVQIPETQWVATAAPTSAFLVDATFLKHLDADGNDRVRVDELQAATAWLAARINTDAGVDARKDVLVVGHLAADQSALKAAAATVIAAVPAGASEHDKDQVTLAQVRAADAPLRERGENGDGIVAPKHLPEKVRALGEQIMGLFPETLNRAGEKGLAPDTLAAFKKAREELLAHVEKKAAVFVWGDDSLARAQRIAAVKDKLDEHFLLCRLVASQPDARERFRLAADRIESLVGDRPAMEKALAALPICPPDPAGVVAFSTLHRGPSFELLSSFAKDVLTPTIGQGEQLPESAWRDLVGKADAILAWQATFDGSPVKGMVDTLKGLDDDVTALDAAQQQDLARKDALQAIADLEKVILFQRHLLDFANSFLAMPDVYTNRRALYERGWGVLAGRRYEMSVLVPDLAAHKAATSNGTTCIIYGKVEDKTGGTFEVAMPKTRGWSTELQPGKRGVFYDLKGTEYDLTVTHIVRHPVSVIEAALTPFLRIGEMVKGKLASLNAGVDEAIAKKTEAVSVRIDGATAAASSAVKPLADKGAAAVGGGSGGSGSGASASSADGGAGRHGQRSRDGRPRRRGGGLVGGVHRQPAEGADPRRCRLHHPHRLPRGRAAVGLRRLAQAASTQHRRAPRGRGLGAQRSPAPDAEPHGPHHPDPVARRRQQPRADGHARGARRARGQPHRLEDPRRRRGAARGALAVPRAPREGRLPHRPPPRRRLRRR
jgi:hypothetical protein